MADITSIKTTQGAQQPVNSDQQLVSLLDRLTYAPIAIGDASAATYTWTTAETVWVSYAAGTCTITLPNDTDVASWPVGETRKLFKNNTSVNVIAFAALTLVSFNRAAVNTAITTLIGSATVPGIATSFPCWTIYRESATSYIFLQGV
jgi:uncharacterized protein YaiE (UPF0345 family)